MKRTFWYAGIAISVVYLLAHLYSLTTFPVFADEAIYIRWAQLIRDDWQRYLLFPLNDGKTPLYMWVLSLTQSLTHDQLASARLVSVLVGLAQLWVTAGIVRALGGRPKTQLLAMGLTAILPFWFFQHQVALIDGMLALWISVSVWCLLNYLKHAKTGWLVGIGLGWGLALLTKLPAVGCIPAFAILFLGTVRAGKRVLRQKMVLVGSSLALGTGMFLLLRLSLSFGQLFSRGSDFLFPIREVVGGRWLQTIQNTPTYLGYFWSYLSPTGFLLLLIGLFSKKHQRPIHLLFWSGVAFVAPIALMGKLVFARYLFPAALFFTPALALTFESVYAGLSTAPLLKKVLGGMVLCVFLANTLTHSLQFDWKLATDPNNTPFVSSDRQQYLLEWSSGHGIREVIDLLRAQTATSTLAVATEGRFGTLPDGILMYLHERDVSKLYVEGIGLPINGLPDTFVTRAASFDSTWLVVNSYRMGITLPPSKLITQYCRPEPTAPCLQVWDVSELVKR